MFSFSDDAAIAKKQLLAIIFYLTAFGHMDGEFDASERRYVRDHIAALVAYRTRTAIGAHDPLARQVTTEKWTAQFQRVADAIDREVAALFTESLAEGESVAQFVHAKLALRCFELLKHFDEAGRARLFEVVDELILADGVVHPNEARFRAEIQHLLEAPVVVDVTDAAEIVEPSVEIAQRRVQVPRSDDHPFFTRLERPYPRDPAAFARAAEQDLQLIAEVEAALGAQREGGRGKLAGATTFADFAGQDPFLDGHVYVLPRKPAKDYELIVIGDLHGCYSCLKAALLQTDFLAKVQAHHDDPEGATDTRLVLLGDYIDRGRFSFDGILRAAMRLFVTVPDSVYLLRGNHEYYIEHQGRVLAPVRPAEAMMSLQGVTTDAFFAEYMRLFEALPTMLAVDRTLFVHAGIPRDDTLAEKWTGLASLNDPELRFQMLWSDPSEAETVPVDLQKSTSRFGFGSRQLRSFLARIGCTTLVRGHERIVEGFRTVYDAPEATLLSLFSAGGKTNLDLPESSNYREVTPMALTIRVQGGKTLVEPFVIDYERFNERAKNRLL